MKDILVEFTGNVGARIIKDPRIIAEKAGQDNVLLNPDTKHLQGISPSFWVKNGNSVEAITPQEAQKLVFDSESSGGMLTPQKLVSFEEKLKEVKGEIDAKRDQDMHYLLRALKNQRKDIDEEILGLDDKLVHQIMDLEKWVKNGQRKIEILSFLYLIAIILIKFL
jgi:hypothetical protein